jgi:hypothetical protein
MLIVGKSEILFFCNKFPLIMVYEKEYFLNSDIKGDFDELWSIIYLYEKGGGGGDRTQTAQSIKFQAC